MGNGDEFARIVARLPDPEWLRLRLIMHLMAAGYFVIVVTLLVLLFGWHWGILATFVAIFGLGTVVAIAIQHRCFSRQHRPCDPW